MSSTGAPEGGGFGVSAVWTGSDMLIWGAGAGTGITAARYSLGHGRDDDVDGFSECAGDCNDADPGVWGIPGDPVGLGFVDGATLEWSSPLSPGGTSLAYDVVRSDSASDFVSAAVCVESADAADTFAVDTGAPEAGLVRHYLVRGGNACGKGPLGFDSSGAERLGRACP